jgi:hypothetical protein
MPAASQVQPAVLDVRIMLLTSAVTATPTYVRAQIEEC